MGFFITFVHKLIFMEYNTKRDPLIIPEYGRHVQKMIAHATKISDKAEQQKCVNAIITFYGTNEPSFT